MGQKKLMTHTLASWGQYVGLLLLFVPGILMILAPDCRSKNRGSGMGASRILVVCLLCICANEVSFYHAQCRASCKSVRARRCCKITPANRRCCCASFSAHTRAHTFLLPRSLLLLLSPFPSRFHHIPSPSVVARTYARTRPRSRPLQLSRMTTADKNRAVYSRSTHRAPVQRMLFGWLQSQPRAAAMG